MRIGNNRKWVTYKSNKQKKICKKDKRSESWTDKNFPSDLSDVARSVVPVSKAIGEGRYGTGPISVPSVFFVLTFMKER